jgi:hypothetical protein
MRLKMSNIISLLVWNQKGKYYMIPLKKGGINFKHLDNKNKLIWLLNTEDKNILLELTIFKCNGHQGPMLKGPTGRINKHEL